MEGTRTRRTRASQGRTVLQVTAIMYASEH